jgi:uncharacterized protein (DUF2062 family)
MCPYVDKNHVCRHYAPRQYGHVSLCIAAAHAIASRPRCVDYSLGTESLNITVKKWLHRRILDPLLSLLRQGISPDRLALCVAIGVVVGNIPILGISTILCAAIALAFRLNLPAIQIVQAAMAPTQILLIIPFVRLGEWILRVPPQAVSIKAGLALMAQGAGPAVAALWDAILPAGFAWILVAPIAVLLFYKLLTPVFERAAAQIR